MHKNLAGERMLTEIDFARLNTLRGQRVGAIARWRSPNGDACAAEIATLLFQPEASGDHTT